MGSVGGISLSSTSHYLVAASDLRYIIKKKKKVLFLLFLTVPMQSLKFHMIIMNVFVDSGSVQCFSIHLGNNLTVRVKGMGA